MKTTPHFNSLEEWAQAQNQRLRDTFTWYCKPEPGLTQEQRDELLVENYYERMLCPPDQQEVKRHDRRKYEVWRSCGNALCVEGSHLHWHFNHWDFATQWDRARHLEADARSAGWIKSFKQRMREYQNNDTVPTITDESLSKYDDVIDDVENLSDDELLRLLAEME
jgi:hypothetical protein